MTSLFITGASGFIGQHFLRDYGDQFSRIILPLRRELDFELPAQAEVYRVDGSADEMVQLLVANPCDYILNAAAYGVAPTGRDADQMLAVNVEMPVALARAANASGAKRFVQLGTMAEYEANRSGKPTHETDAVIFDKTSYGGSKAEATKQLHGLSEKGKTGVTCLRLFGVFGSGEAPHRLLSALQTKLSAGEVVPMSEGSQVRDFIYVPDVTAAMFAALTQIDQPDFAIYNIGSGQGISVRDFAKSFCRLGRYRPDQLDFGALPMRDTDVPFMVADIEAAKAELGWTPKWTTETALADFLSKSQYRPQF